LTGWAQLRIGYANDVAEEIDKMRYDLYYIEHQSLAFDLQIMVETLKIVLFGREGMEQGAATPGSAGEGVDRRPRCTA
jgi:lipopolysaccharide/colanic/teichoic acid biosynthesis glycosyltransferase